MSNENTKNASWAARIIGVMAWTGLCGLVWILWLGSMASKSDQTGVENPDAFLAGAACVATGCTGGVWFGGLLVAMVIYAVIRR